MKFKVGEKCKIKVIKDRTILGDYESLDGSYDGKKATIVELPKQGRLYRVKCDERFIPCLEEELTSYFPNWKTRIGD